MNRSVFRSSLDLLRPLLSMVLWVVLSVPPLQAIALSIRDNSFAYATDYTDRESGLHYLVARYHNPKLRRFVSRDSLALMNRYTYANDNPILNADPSGHNATMDNITGVIHHTWDSFVASRWSISTIAFSTVALSPLFMIKGLAFSEVVWPLTSRMLAPIAYGLVNGLVPNRQIVNFVTAVVTSVSTFQALISGIGYGGGWPGYLGALFYIGALAVANSDSNKIPTWMPSLLLSVGTLFNVWSLRRSFDVAKAEVPVEDEHSQNSLTSLSKNGEPSQQEEPVERLPQAHDKQQEGSDLVNIDLNQ